MRGAGAVDFAAGVVATVALGATGFAAAFGAGAVLLTVLWAVLAATFEAVAFEPVAFAAVFAVFFGIALLLFLEDFAAEAALPPVREFRPRPLDAPWLAEAVFRDGFKVL